MISDALAVERISTIDEVRSLVQVLEPFADEQERLFEMIAESGCLLKGHFALLSGQHSSYFLEFRGFASLRSNVDFAVSLLNQRLQELPDFEVLLAPETAGSILARGLAEKLEMLSGPVIVPTDQLGRPVPELEPGALAEGKKVLVVNDLVTAGRGLQGLVHCVRQAKAKVVGVALFANRNPEGPLAAIESADFREIRVIDLDVDHFGPEGGPTNETNCRLCREEKPVTQGHDLI